MNNLNIIFIHGWLFDSRIWNGLDKLFVDFNTQKCDLPGYGKNYSSRLSHDEYCFDLLSEAKKPLVVIAWSYGGILALNHFIACLLYTSPSPRDVEESRMPSSA